MELKTKGKKSKKGKRGYDDNGDKLCGCKVLLLGHGGPCGQPGHSRNAGSVPYYEPKNEEENKAE